MEKKKIDTKELEKELNLAETVFVRDIDNKVFQSIVLQCLSQIEGISLVEGNFIDHLFGRSAEGIKGIIAEQNDKNCSLDIRVEVNVTYGTVIPEKAEEIQTKIVEEITSLTGLHVGTVHVVFKNLISPEMLSKMQQKALAQPQPVGSPEEEFTNDF